MGAIDRSGCALTLVGGTSTTDGSIRFRRLHLAETRAYARCMLKRASFCHLLSALSDYLVITVVEGIQHSEGVGDEKPLL